MRVGRVRGVLRSLAAVLGLTAMAGLATAGGAAAGGMPAAGTAASARAATSGDLAGVVSIRPAWIHAGRAVTGGPPSGGYCRAHFRIACYRPAQLRRAYDVTPLLRSGIDGRGQTIVIVDSFGSPTIRHDLAVFDKGTGLAPPPSLTVIRPAGTVPPYQPTPTREGWAGETDLDVEYAHAMAPGASILVVETPTSENEGTTGFPQIVQAENDVISRHLGAVISQSFSATERTFPSAGTLMRLRGAYVNAARAGVTVLAASGDSGAADARFNGTTYYLHRVTSWPDSDPLVTGVGGTELRQGPGPGQWSSLAWNDTYRPAVNQFVFGNKGPNPLAGGGGRSIMFTRPGFQNGVRAVTGTHRGVPDIAMSAACSGAVVMYQSFPGQAAGWYPTCGTSEATPLFAGVVALAAQEAGHPLGLINPRLYALAATRQGTGITDVTAGNNTVSFRQGGTRYTVPGYQAGPGYDLASGLGTVNAALLVPRLAGRAP